MTSLRVLYLDYTRVTDTGLKHLEGLKNLECLSLEWTLITDAGLQHLKGLTKLNGLMLDGTKVEGTIRYIAPESDAQSRTFRFELEVDNSGGDQLMGMSAEIHLPVRTVEAHQLTPAILSLNDAGEVGVKGIDSEGIVHFYPSEIALSDSEGIWLTGLPTEVDLITVGQGFVRDGDKVEKVFEE